ncbi:MAG: GIY-YIG nuclease family protein [Clostridiales bacterium]|nr:GIY-YIG nuclease family protein [Clostridiales bacterium]
MSIPTRLKEKLASIPELPGIYKMLDARGNIIYIGKSKCLKKRVRSYFTKNNKWHKVEKLVAFIDDIDFHVTDTHLEACLLECKLIKEIRPVFNSQMKNHERYVYLEVTSDYNPHKPLNVESSRISYSYGPFRHRYRLLEIIASLNNLFPLTKDDTGYHYDYHPLPKLMNEDEFYVNRDILIDLFSNTKSMESFIKSLEVRMIDFAQSFKYETASKYRDIIKGLNYINYRISDYNKFLSSNYLLKIPANFGTKLFLISGGFIINKQEYTNPSKEDIDSFISSGLTNKESYFKVLSEKAAIDFHDIIYSEIKSLDKELYSII